MNKRLLSMLLALSIIFTMLPVTAMAEETRIPIGASREVIALEPLAGTEETVTTDISTEDLDLPETLAATVRTAVLAGAEPVQDSGSPDGDTAAAETTVATTSSTLEAEVSKTGETVGYTITLRYVNNDRNATTTVQTDANGRLTELPAHGTDPDGKTFYVWYINDAAKTEVTTDTVFTKDTIIYAQWGLIQLTLKGGYPNQIKMGSSESIYYNTHSPDYKGTISYAIKAGEPVILSLTPRYNGGVNATALMIGTTTVVVTAPEDGRFGSTTEEKTITVVPKSIYIDHTGITASKVYDGNDSLTSTQLQNVPSTIQFRDKNDNTGIPVALEPDEYTGTLTAYVGTKNAGTGRTLIFGGITLTDEGAKTYKLESSRSTAGTIEKKPITLTADILAGLTAQKVQGVDGVTLSMASHQFATGVGSEKLTIALKPGAATPSLEDDTVGTGKSYTVSADSFVITNDANNGYAANYSVSGDVTMTNGVVSPRPSATPTVSAATVVKTSPTQASISFTLTNIPVYEDGQTWKVYSASTGATLASGVTAANIGNTLTLTHATDVPAATYYVAVTESGKTESARLALTVGAYVPTSLTGTVTISGTPQYGQTLTATYNAGNNTGNLSYQWKRNGNDITGATTNTYTIVQTDIDQILTCEVTSTLHTGSVSSDATATIERADGPTGIATISNTSPRIGDTLTASLAGDNNSGVLTYVWKAAGTQVGTGTSYTVAASDLGNTITLEITSSVQSGMVTSTPTAAVLRKAAPSAPGAPILVSKTYNSVTLAANVAYEFSTDGVAWQTSNVFSGLTASTTYTFYQRLAETDDTESTTASEGLRVTTDSHSSGGGSGSGGSGGGSTNDNSDSVIDTPPTPDKEDSQVQAEIKISGTVDSKGNITVNITEETVTEALDKAIKDTKKNGDEPSDIILILHVDTGSKTGSNVTVNLPKAVQDAIIASKIDSIVVVVDNPDIRIDMDLESLKEINKQAKADVNITATRTDNDELTKDAKKAIGSRPVFDLKVNYGKDKQVESFGSGSVSVAIPYTLGKNENTGNILAVYVDARGKVHWLVNSFYDSEEKVLRFSTDHFSTYGIGYKQINVTYKDIAGHWAKEDIEFVISRGLLDGTSKTKFNPDKAMTRGMVVTALGRLADADVSSYKKSSFSDVKKDASYMGFIEWACKKNQIAKTVQGLLSPIRGRVIANNSRTP